MCGGEAVSVICVGGKGPGDTSWNKWENYISSYILLAMPSLRQLVTGLSSQRSGYDPLPLHVAFRVDEVVFCRVVEFIPHQPVLHALLRTCLKQLVIHYQYFIFSFFSATRNYLGTGFIRIHKF